MSTPDPLDAAFRKQASALMSDAVAGWARVLDHALASLVALWKIPLDMVYPEDTSLGVCNTSIIVPAASAVSVRCTGARLVPTGRPAGGPTSPDIAAEVRITAPAQASANATVCELEINLPATARPGLYELTFNDQSTGETWVEYHPFGVPRGDH